MEDHKATKILKVVKYARKGQHEKLVSALKKDGELVNSTDHKKQSALFHAALNGHKKCLKELLKRGADPNQVSINGYTPCHAAALGGRSPRFPHGIYEARNPIIGLRLWMEGLRNILSYHLHDSNSQRRCLEYLICFGGDWKLTSHKQENTKDIAVQRMKESIVEMIKEYNQLQLAASSPTANDEVAFQTRYGYWVHSNFSKGDLAAFPSISKGMEKQGESLAHKESRVIREARPDEIKLVSRHCRSKYMDGSVWTRGFWKEGILVTLRQLPDKDEMKRDKKSVMCVEYLLREMENLRNMHHPNVVMLMGTCTGPLQKDMFLVLEPLQIAGSLHSILHVEHDKFSIMDTVCIIKDIVNAVVYLHNVMGVAHCIISSHAVHFCPKGNAKLCNMFCSQPAATMIPGLYSSALRLYLPWMAPELMLTRISSFESDIFSIGVLIWEIWAGTPPWPGLTPPQLGRALVKDGQRLPLTSKHSPVAQILKTCFGPATSRFPATKLLSQVNYLKLSHCLNS